MWKANFFVILLHKISKQKNKKETDERKIGVMGKTQIASEIMGNNILFPYVFYTIIYR